MHKTILLSLSLFFVSYSISAQNQNLVEDMEVTIHGMFEELFLSDGTKFIQPDSTKLALSYEISEQFKELLVNKESFNYPYDSLKRIGIRMSQDKKVKTYTWSIKLENGEHIYYGFVQQKDGKKLKVYQLKDDSRKMKSDVEYLALDHKHWYGANYYKIVDFKYRGKKMYALLGMRSNKYISKIKIIEILSFSGKKAKFGHRVFKFDKKDDPEKTKRKQYRILMEYDQKVSTTLNYDERYKMIIFDHLVPENSKLKNIRRFYGPDGSYDAFAFDGFKWKYIPDKWAVNKRNRKQDNLKGKGIHYKF